MLSEKKSTSILAVFQAISQLLSPEIKLKMLKNLADLMLPFNNYDILNGHII